MCVARKQREGGEPSSGHYGRSMLSYSNTTEPNEYIYGRFCTAHFGAAWLVPMSASVECVFHKETTFTSSRSIGSIATRPGPAAKTRSLTHTNSKNLSETSAQQRLTGTPA